MRKEKEAHSMRWGEHNFPMSFLSQWERTGQNPREASSFLPGALAVARQVVQLNKFLNNGLAPALRNPLGNTGVQMTLDQHPL